MQELFGTTGALDRVNFAGKTDWGILLESLQPVGFTPEQIQARLADYNRGRRAASEPVIADFPVQPCVGAPEVVAALRAHPQAVIGLVTGNMEGLVPIKLRAAGYDPADFKIGAFGSEGCDRDPCCRRWPWNARKAYTGSDFAPEQIVIMGDTPGDIACAESIGARTIAVATGPYKVGELRVHHPDHVFETLADTDARCWPRSSPMGMAANPSDDERRFRRALVLGIIIAGAGDVCLVGGVVLLVWRVLEPEEAVILPPGIAGTPEMTPTPGLFGAPLPPPPLPTDLAQIVILPVSERPTPHQPGFTRFHQRF